MKKKHAWAGLAKKAGVSLATYIERRDAKRRKTLARTIAKRNRMKLLAGPAGSGDPNGYGAEREIEAQRQIVRQEIHVEPIVPAAKPANLPSEARGWIQRSDGSIVFEGADGKTYELQPGGEARELAALGAAKPAAEELTLGRVMHAMEALSDLSDDEYNDLCLRVKAIRRIDP